MTEHNQALKQTLAELGNTLQQAGIKTEPTPAPTEEPKVTSETKPEPSRLVRHNRQSFTTLDLTAGYNVATVSGIDKNLAPIAGPDVQLRSTVNFTLSKNHTIRGFLEASLGYTDLSSQKNTVGDDDYNITSQYLTPLSNTVIAKIGAGVNVPLGNRNIGSASVGFNIPNSRTDVTLGWSKQTDDKGHQVGVSLSGKFGPQGNVGEIRGTYKFNRWLSADLVAGLTTTRLYTDYYLRAPINQFQDHSATKSTAQTPYSTHKGGIPQLDTSIRYSEIGDTTAAPYFGGTLRLSLPNKKAVIGF